MVPSEVQRHCSQIGSPASDSETLSRGPAPSCQQSMRLNREKPPWAGSGHNFPGRDGGIAPEKKNPAGSRAGCRGISLGISTGPLRSQTRWVQGTAAPRGRQHSEELKPGTNQGDFSVVHPALPLTCWLIPGKSFPISAPQFLLTAFQINNNKKKRV